MAGSLRWCALALVATAGCGKSSATADAGEPDARPDAPIPLSCLFMPPATPTGGVAELGNADPPNLNNFTVVKPSDTYQVYEGPQGGYHLWIDSRIQGIDLGDGSNIKTRPQTKFHIFTAAGKR